MEAITSNNKRILYIDIAKCIGIFLVVLGHTVSADTMCKSFLYSFHMPLFFILSGMVNKDYIIESKEDAFDFLKKKFFSLFVPYFIWGCIYSKFTIKNILFILYGTRECLLFADSLSSLWFLPVLFVASIIFLIVKNISKGKKFIEWLFILLLMSVGLFIPHLSKYGYPFGFDVAVVAASFMLIGNQIVEIINIIKNKIWLVLFSLFVFTVGFLIVFNFSYIENEYVLMANAVYGKKIPFLLTSISGSIAIILFSTVIEIIPIPKKIILQVGKNTLGIFIIHKLLIDYLRLFAISFGFDFNNVFIAIILTLINLAISSIIVLIIKKIIPEIMGIKKSK